MFKSRSGHTPRTPKITSVSLPDDDYVGPGPVNPYRQQEQQQHHVHLPVHKQAKHRVEKMGFFDRIRSGGHGHGHGERRAATPLPERPTRMTGSTDSERSRTVSMSSTSSYTGPPPKSILKTPKNHSTRIQPAAPMPEKLGYIVPGPNGPVFQREPYKVTNPVSAPAPLSRQSSMRGSRRDSYSRDAPQPAARESYSKPIPAHAKSYPSYPTHSGSYPSHQAYTQTPAQPPPIPFPVQETAPSKHSHNSSSRRSSKYGPAGIRGYDSVSPLKDEAIALSWPLLDYQQGKRKQQSPLLYFDVAFDPMIPLNVRISRGDIAVKLSANEQDLPASSHCKMTKMTITCKPLPEWPIHVERKEGIRCIDVFCAIYKTLHQPLTARELETRRSRDPGMLHPKFHEAFLQRCRDSPGVTEYNEKQGYLRVDILRGRRIFKGIASSGPDWELSIDGHP